MHVQMPCRDPCHRIVCQRECFLITAQPTQCLNLRGGSDAWIRYPIRRVGDSDGFIERLESAIVFLSATNPAP